MYPRKAGEKAYPSNASTYRQTIKFFGDPRIAKLKF
jgi:hypothetical protein